MTAIKLTPAQDHTRLDATPCFYCGHAKFRHTNGRGSCGKQAIGYGADCYCVRFKAPMKLTAAQDRVVRLLAEGDDIYMSGAFGTYDSNNGRFLPKTVKPMISAGLIIGKYYGHTSHRIYQDRHLHLTDAGRAYAKSKGWVQG